MFKRCISVGSITVDRLQSGTRLGGSALYSALCAKALGYEPMIVAACADEEREKLLQMGFNVHIQSSPVSTVFEHVYDMRGNRQSLCTAQSDTLTVSTLEGVAITSEDIVMVCPNVHDVSPGIIAALKNNPWTFLPQGWFRRIDRESRVTHADVFFKEATFKADLIVVSEEDISGSTSALEWLQLRSHRLVFTRGHGTMSLYENGSLLRDMNVPRVAEEVDPTGAGDTFATILTISLKEGLSFTDSVLRASLGTSLKIEQRGLVMPDPKILEELFWHAKKIQRS